MYSGPSPLTVAFTGRYIGNPTSYLWQFGDGTANVTTANAVHTFSNALGGTFTVTFTAYNTNGTYNGNAALGAKGSTSTANIQTLCCTHQVRYHRLHLAPTVSTLETVSQ